VNEKINFNSITMPKIKNTIPTMPLILNWARRKIEESFEGGVIPLPVKAE
jgi:hypothetical protein